MTQLTPNGIKFKDEDQEQTKAICSVDGVTADSNGNIPVDFTSITTTLDDLENRLDNIGDGASSYTLSATPNPVNEGVSVTITLDTTNVFPGEEIPYTITPNGVSLTDDFVSPIASTGHFKIENDTADLVLAIKEDDLTESSPESFTLTLNAGNNPYITVNINDTSQTPVPTYNLSASPNPASENQTVTVTLSTTNVANGTYVPYTISTSGISLTQDFTSTVASTGNFQVYNNQATRTFPLKQDELTENASESFTLTLNAGNNPAVTVNVNDTSQTPTSIDILPYLTVRSMSLSNFQEYDFWIHNFDFHNGAAYSPYYDANYGVGKVQEGFSLFFSFRVPKSLGLNTLDFSMSGGFSLLGHEWDETDFDLIVGDSIVSPPTLSGTIPSLPDYNSGTTHTYSDDYETFRLQLFIKDEGVSESWVVHSGGILGGPQGTSYGSDNFTITFTNENVSPRIMVDVNVWDTWAVGPGKGVTFTPV